MEMILATKFLVERYHPECTICYKKMQVGERWWKASRCSPVLYYCDNCVESKPREEHVHVI
jgi:hypothetical protein